MTENVNPDFINLYGNNPPKINNKKMMIAHVQTKKQEIQ